jgi:hypothetical protein
MDEVAGAQLLLDRRRLLVEDHPRVEGRADDRRAHEQKIAIADWQIDRVPRQRRQARMRGPGDDEERQLEPADDQGHTLDPLVGPARHDDEERRSDERQREAAREPEQLADPGDAGELRDQ